MTAKFGFTKCDICQEPAAGLLTVRFYPEDNMDPHTVIAAVYACEKCEAMDIWHRVIAQSSVQLTKVLGKVVAYGHPWEREQKVAQVRRRDMPFTWCPRIDIGLTPLDDARAASTLADIAQVDKNTHVLSGGRVQ